jgi:hypothetical protein
LPLPVAAQPAGSAVCKQKWCRFCVLGLVCARVLACVCARKRCIARAAPPAPAKPFSHSRHPRHALQLIIYVPNGFVCRNSCARTGKGSGWWCIMGGGAAPRRGLIGLIGSLASSAAANGLQST